MGLVTMSRSHCDPACTSVIVRHVTSLSSASRPHSSQCWSGFLQQPGTTNCITHCVRRPRNGPAESRLACATPSHRERERVFTQQRPQLTVWNSAGPPS